MTTEPDSRRPQIDNVASFSEIEADVQARSARIAWATVATVDRKGRPRTRILHPIWETVDGKPVGYIATDRGSHKGKHLAQNPNVSVSYWDQAHEQMYVDAVAEWADDAAEKRRVWDLFKNAPPPLGYDPVMIWPDGPDAPSFGVLKLTPWRVELFSLGDMFAGKAPRVWRG